VVRAALETLEEKRDCLDFSQKQAIITAALSLIYLSI
jgi:hypothetical protein